jgi:REP element-mobilizing transposase RayT
MARKPRLLFEGAIYHVTVRGNARQSIFSDDADRRRFLDRLFEAAEDHGVRIYLFCLMSNHVHLLVETPRANLSAFMAVVLTGYALYFNRRHRRVGHLYQGRFGAQLVEGSVYLLKLSRYIHLNPVHVGSWRSLPLEARVKQLREYRWSSYRGYAGLEKKRASVAYAPALAMMTGRGAVELRYRRFVEAGLAQTDDEFVSLLRESPWMLGSERYCNKVQSRLEDRLLRCRREDANLRKVLRRESADTVMADVCRVLGVRGEDLTRKRRDGTERAMAAYALVRRAGYTQRQAADRLGMKTGAAVSLLIRSLKNQMNRDKETRRLVDRLALPQLSS